MMTDSKEPAATTLETSFVAVFIPEDEQMEPYEVTLPADCSYHQR